MYKRQYEQTELRLGEHASEDTARKARYEFLFSLMKKYKAESIITAHHQDDVVETMIVNILRGTGARGLVGFTRRGVLRPLINKTKKELVEYAKEHKLTWREDSTNSDESYLRNYVRSHFLPKLGSKRQQLLDIRIQAHEQVQEINELTKKLLVNSMRKGELVRARFVVLPFSVQKEVVAMWLRLHDIPFDAATIDRLTLAAKTLAAGKQVDITKTARLDIGKETISLKKL